MTTLANQDGFAYICAMDAVNRHIGLTFPHKTYSRVWQEQQLRVAGAKYIEHVGLKGGAALSWRDLDSGTVIRPGDVVYVVALVFVPTAKGKDKLSPISQANRVLCMLVERKALLVETWTGRKSNNWRAREAMIADAEVSLRSGGRRLPQGHRDPGRKKAEWTSEQIEQARTAWKSRDYATNDAAERHMPKMKDVDGNEIKFTKWRAGRMFGPSGRPWKRKQKSRT